MQGSRKAGKRWQKYIHKTPRDFSPDRDVALTTTTMAKELVA
jgi:hypothetical protein